MTDQPQEGTQQIIVGTNGYQRDAKTGRWIAPPPAAKFTTDTAKLAVKQRMEKRAQAYADGMIEAFQDGQKSNANPTTPTLESAIKKMAGHLFTIATTKQGKEAIMAADHLIDMTDLKADRRSQATDGSGPVNVTVNAAQIVLQYLVNPTYGNDSSQKYDAIQADDNVIDGTAHDAHDDMAGKA